MISSGGRVLLVAEHRTGGAALVPAARVHDSRDAVRVQDARPDDAAAAGAEHRDAALFLINNWINTDPRRSRRTPRWSTPESSCVDRARRCERQRQFPNVLNVDFYEQGDLFGAVDELNGVR